MLGGITDLVAGFIISQLDTPLPGPADAAGSVLILKGLRSVGIAMELSGATKVLTAGKMTMSASSNGTGGTSDRGLDSTLGNKKTAERFFKSKFVNNRPFSNADATKIWKWLEENGWKPKLDPPHPGSKWDYHIRAYVRGFGSKIHIPVRPDFVIPK